MLLCSAFPSALDLSCSGCFLFFSSFSFSGFSTPLYDCKEVYSFHLRRSDIAPSSPVFFFVTNFFSFPLLSPWRPEKSRSGAGKPCLTRSPPFFFPTPLFYFHLPFPLPVFLSLAVASWARFLYQAGMFSDFSDFVVVIFRAGLSFTIQPPFACHWDLPPYAGWPQFGTLHFFVCSTCEMFFKNGVFWRSFCFMFHGLSLDTRKVESAIFFEFSSSSYFFFFFRSLFFLLYSFPTGGWDQIFSGTVRDRFS